MMRFLQLVLFFAILFCVPIGLQGAPTNAISIKGVWRFQTDPSDVGVDAKWFTQTLKGSIKLPGSMVENGLGDELTLKTPWTGSIYDSSWFYNPKMEKYRKPGNIKFPFWLTPNKYYLGAAWYQKDIEIPADWKDKRIVLTLERPHFTVTVWVDDKKVGEQNSLSCAHEYELTPFISTGKHTITLRIDNRLTPMNIGKDSHSVTDHTQGNWNGVVGKMELSATAKVHISDVRVFPNLADKTAKIQIMIAGDGDKNGSVEVAAQSFNSAKQHIVKALSSKFTSTKKLDTLTITYPMGDEVQFWDEFSPALYNLSIKYSDKAKNKDEKTVVFGMREFKTRSTRFTINGTPTFLRGTVENCVFPLTGYAPMDEDGWARVFKICKEAGLNHMRFHSFCPPEAAFIAADKAGIYLQIECGSWANHGVTLGGGEPVDRYIYDESERIVKEYGNHPSFVMMAYGNEPKGRYVPYLTKFVDYWKARDNRRLYTGASTGGSWSVIPNSEFQVRARPRGLNSWNKKPETEFDFRDKLENFTVPYISHEVAQYCVFPNFEEIKKYTGPLKAKNLELFQEDLNDNHMGDQAKDFLMASGKLQALCYKGEIEAALRTPGFGGFQLLGLNDYTGQGTALVGMLDPFWDEKGYITKAEIKNFCNSTVPLARIPKFVYTNNETFTATVEVSHFGAQALTGAKSGWKISDSNGKVLGSGSFDPKNIAIDNCISLGKIEWPLAGITTASKLRLDVTIQNFSNNWEIWVYPAQTPALDTTQVVYCRSVEIAEQALKEGKKVFLDASGKVENGRDIVQSFTPVFWNTSWFKMKPPHTTGLLVNPSNPVFSNFPTDFYANMQWAELMNGQQVMNLENFPADFRPIVQPIDTWFINRRLAMLFEAKVGNGKLVVCSANLTRESDKRIVARQLAYSINKYMTSESFNPKNEVDITVVKELFEKKDRRGFQVNTKDAPDELKPQNQLK